MELWSEPCNVTPTLGILHPLSVSSELTHMTYLLSLAQCRPNPFLSTPTSPGDHRQICCGWLLSVKPEQDMNWHPGTIQSVRIKATILTQLDAFESVRFNLVLWLVIVNQRRHFTQTLHEDITLKCTSEFLTLRILSWSLQHQSIEGSFCLPVMNMLISGNKRRRIPDYYSAPQKLSPGFIELINWLLNSDYPLS